MNRKQTEKNPLRIALIGASGSMGREIDRLAPDEGAEIVLRFDAENPLPEEMRETEFDVAIEFSLPANVLDSIRTVVGWRKPIVVGTTGWYDSLEEVTGIVGEHEGRLIWASNFSVGVQAFFSVVREAAKLFNKIERYDVAVHEEHHVRKADSPSGTAVSLGNLLLESIDRKRSALVETAHGRIPSDALHITSRRIGETIGTHVVTFDAGADTIELVHRAKNRSGFALGALAAARWIVGAEPGTYRLDDVFEEIL